jgi:eukaryotic-like serine/threonine-protein kinase
MTADPMLDDSHHAEPEAVDDELIGTLLAERYRLQSLIGHGGMASVYRAEDELLARPVAVKLFPPNATGPLDLRRETSEIRTLASLNHHALVTVFDANMTDNATDRRAYLVMELVDGKTLRHRIEDGPLEPQVVAAMALDLAEALHVVHERGIVHRDIKPDNVLLSASPTPDRDFRAKLADFGIAVLTDSTRLTAPGTVIGTAAYLSPEQARGEPATPASDVYSLGLVLLESLTGEKAYAGTMVESIAAKISTDPQIPSEFGYEWKSLLTAMTARAPDARPSAWDVAESAHALIDEAESDGLAITGMMAANDVAPDDVTEVMHVGMVDAVDADAAPDSAPVAGPAPVPAADPDLTRTPVLPTSAERQDVFAMPSEVQGQLQGEFADRREPRTPVTGESLAAPPRHRRRIVPIVLVVILLILVTAAVIYFVVSSGQAQSGSPAPSLPAVGGQLGEHLRELMRSVTP